MIDTLQSFTPDWVSPPGETIADILEERNWTQVQLAKRLGFTEKHISQLINGNASITEDTALRLEKVLGSTAAFWLNREAQYRAQVAKIAEQNRLASWVSWLDELPVKELMNQNIISNRRMDSKNKPDIVKDLLAFFGVASPDDWRNHYVGMQASFRQTRPDQCNVGAISAWLRQGEIIAEQQPVFVRYNKATFEKSVEEIRKLTVLPPKEFVPRMQELCQSAGVIFVLVPSIPTARTSGVARWLNHCALIQLSLYGKTNDKFWFNFFHEAAHILLHGNQKKCIFLDNGVQDDELQSQQEQEADQWAREFLIPSEYDAELLSLKSKKSVELFAKKVGIHPAIVVGRLQHEGRVKMHFMNSLKRNFDVDDVQLPSRSVNT